MEIRQQQQQQQQENNEERSVLTKAECRRPKTLNIKCSIVADFYKITIYCVFEHVLTLYLNWIKKTTSTKKKKKNKPKERLDFRNHFI